MSPPHRSNRHSSALTGRAIRLIWSFLWTSVACPLDRRFDPTTSTYPTSNGSINTLSSTVSAATSGRDGAAVGSVGVTGTAVAVSFSVQAKAKAIKSTRGMSNNTEIGLPVNRFTAASRYIRMPPCWDSEPTRSVATWGQVHQTKLPHSASYHNTLARHYNGWPNLGGLP